MVITERIAALLRENHCTQRELCLYLGVAPSTISDWFKRRNESIPSWYIVPLCRFFNISPEELLTGQTGERLLLDPDEQTLIANCRKLDPEGRTVVQAAAIAERRRIEKTKET